MADQLHPESAPTTAGGESAVDQIAALLDEAAVEESQAGEPVEPDESTEELQAESDGYEDGDEAETDDPSQDEAEDDDGDDSDDIAALATELGLDADKIAIGDDGEVLIKMRVNGQDEHVSLSEALSGAQHRRANDQKSQALAADRKSFEEEREAVMNSHQEQMRQAQGLGEMLQSQLMQEYQSTDWDRLKVEDPGMFAVKQMEFQQRNQELHMAGQRLGEQMRLVEQEKEQQFQHERAQILESERQLMLEVNPSWADQEVMKSDLSEIVDYARGLGFSDDELQDVIYSRHVSVLQKAMAFDKGATVVEKKRKTPPKMARASNGRFQSKKDTKLNRLVERAKNAKGGEAREARAEAVLAILGE